MGQTLFTFSSPVTPEETIKLIEQAVLSIGGKVKSHIGYMECSWKRKGALMATKFEFYVGQTVRAVPAMNYVTELSTALILKKTAWIAYGDVLSNLYFNKTRDSIYQPENQ